MKDHAILGVGIAGQLEAVGRNVKQFQLGDEVLDTFLEELAAGTTFDAEKPDWVRVKLESRSRYSTPRLFRFPDFAETVGVAGPGLEPGKP